MTPYATYTDEELAALLLHSNEGAFTEIYTRYWQRLFFIAAKKTKDPYEAEGLVQEVFLDIWRRREQLALHGLLRHYLAVALKYRFINWQAKRGRASAYVSYVSHQMPGPDNSPESWLSFEELRDRLAALVAGLPEKCRIAYQLKEEGLSQKDIAVQMNVSENTVATHLARARKSLRAALGDFFILFL